ncbi:permease for cytosine/purines, uracil, thiamine, allantoin-domain-containing protein [Aspergillus pseudonomiae]|uniref:Permease for cytosine/purines, uracil, thiamine, allantoin-domain-containing protein n=1 Tax=Aspergillus pseudonomiae TaxID=1506151 RepID=A0A5N7DT48_9EURO|nr:permease for cytosine/purines, uracil, thiamine, allantoin-domain-containing protein [Aspergillus pseudonomiae]KAE8409612.1 permease for cytosine/purines, uracil, thiamine, allantoin-domain-containing protein [Aspergillus pseudonomiae]
MMDTYTLEAGKEAQAGLSSVPFEEETPTKPRGLLARIRYYEEYLDKKLGIESHSLDRVLPEGRNPPNSLAMAFMWASATMNISCFSTGFLGKQFGLSLGQTIPIIICSTLLGAAVTGWCATMGPETGLRQVAISRYSLGFYPSSIIALLNVIEQLGWASVNCITGGLALSAVSDGHVSIAVGVVIVACISFLFSFIGLKGVLMYEQYAWMVFFVIFMIIYGESAHRANLAAPATVSGITRSGNVLSLISVVYGSSASWSSIVSDFYVHYPVNISKVKVFLYTTLGITIPTCIGMLLGACISSALDTNPEWAAAYGNGIGEILQEIIYPSGFAKFLLVLLVLSGIGVNCIAIYSSALSAQLFAKPCEKVPRAIWSTLVFGCILALGIAGRDHLLDVLENFLSLLGYWNTSFFVILFCEHYVFRGGNVANYDLDAWNTPSKMPIGFAGLTAFLCGAAGWIVGMVETYYVGAIAKLIGADGGDIANELALVFTSVSYIPLRKLELKYIGR